FDNQATHFDVPLGNGVYRLVHPDHSEAGLLKYGAVDECSKLNINTATQDMLLRLPQAETTPEIIDCILDWRDEDQDPREFGAEDEYYMTLDEPYLTKNTLFDTLDELMIVKDMSVSLLYGEDINTNGIMENNENDAELTYPFDNADGSLDKGWYPFLTCFSYEKNTDGQGESRVNINSANKQAMQETFGDALEERDIDNIIQQRDNTQFQSIGNLLDVNGINKEKFIEIADQVTISDEERLMGRININTAPTEVLRCLFGTENEDLVQAIIEFRASSDGPFENVGQLLDVKGMDNTQFKNVANLICTKSSVFSIRAIGYIEQSKTYKEIFAIVDRGETPPQIRYWKVIR
ncbi:MAG: type II secretion system protein GspK, partial [bacterium]|nr:type II secretion system protein GspK [bacterium]